MRENKIISPAGEKRVSPGVGWGTNVSFHFLVKEPGDFMCEDSEGCSFRSDAVGRLLRLVGTRNVANESKLLNEVLDQSFTNQKDAAKSEITEI